MPHYSPRRRTASSLWVCLSILGALAADSCGANSVNGPGSQSGQRSPYPNQPAGYTRIAETNDTILPFGTGSGGVLGLLGTPSGVLAGTVANAGSNPSTLLTVVSGANLPVNFLSQASAQKFVFEAGTPPGYQEAGSDGAGYYLWDNTTLTGANGGPAANEYSAYYQRLVLGLRQRIDHRNTGRGHVQAVLHGQHLQQHEQQWGIYAVLYRAASACSAA